MRERDGTMVERSLPGESIKQRHESAWALVSDARRRELLRAADKAKRLVFVRMAAVMMTM